jgi:hypothetical protein
MAARKVVDFGVNEREGGGRVMVGGLGAHKLREESETRLRINLSAVAGGPTLSESEDSTKQKVIIGSD